MHLKIKYKTILAAAAVLLLVIAIILPVHKGGKEKNGPGSKSINSVITNEMSDTASLAKLDRDMKRFMQQWQIRGLELSIMRNDSLVYAKGYGLADQFSGEEMTPGHIMRVASVSKLITAAGIMKLVEEGRLSLSSKVFAPGGPLADTLYTNHITDKAYYDITVEDLLRHESGLSIRRGDPMFTTRDIMNIYHLDEAPDSKTLTSLAVRRRLAFRPGNGNEYSNFGYLLLSMVIESVTGKDYEEWMQENVLHPAGCYDMHLAYNYFEQKYPNETRYHMQDNDPRVPEYNNSADSVVRCYGGNDIRALKGAGAWVCSAAELARFVASIDGRPQVPDILSKSSVRAMTAYIPEHKYSLGWNDTDPFKGWLRTGTLSGTSAYVMYYPDGECWILISNTHNWKGPRFSRTLRSFVKQCKDRYSASIPARNLFDLVK